MSFNKKVGKTTEKVKYFVRKKLECFIYYVSTQKDCLALFFVELFFCYLVGQSYTWLQRWSSVSIEVVLKYIQFIFSSKGVPSVAMSASQGNFKFAK